MAKIIRIDDETVSIRLRAIYRRCLDTTRICQAKTQSQGSPNTPGGAPYSRRFRYTGYIAMPTFGGVQRFDRPCTWRTFFYAALPSESRGRLCVIAFGVLGDALLFERLTGTCCPEIVRRFRPGLLWVHAHPRGV
jgi:hypothetical protein